MPTITAKPATRVEPACRTHPDRWFSTEHDDRVLAVHICLNHCPLLDECRNFTNHLPVAGTVQAGVLYTATTGQPDERQPTPVMTNCRACKGTPTADKPVRPTSTWDDCGQRKAYIRHKRRSENPCEPCKAANRQAKRDWAAGRPRPVENRCGTLTGLVRHREAGEPVCAVCVEATHRNAARARMTRFGDASAQQAKVDKVRRLAGQRMSDGRIAAELKLSKRQIQRIRRAHNIAPGTTPEWARVAA